MSRSLTRLLPWVLVGACHRANPPEPVVAPPDHGPAFVRDHQVPGDCAACHGPQPCARCHLTRPPVDHRPGYAGPAHGFAARLQLSRCATCHVPATCADCHAR